MGCTASSMHKSQDTGERRIVVLEPEMFGEIANFLEMGNADMTSLLLCLGPNTSGIVRKMYLADNMYYLNYCMREKLAPAGGRNRLWRRGRGRGDDRARFAATKSRIMTWMEHSERWKEWCQGRNLIEHIPSLSLTADQVEQLEFDQDFGGRITCKVYKLLLAIFDNFDSNTQGAVLGLHAETGYGRFDPVISSVGETNVEVPCTIDQFRTIIDRETPDQDGKIVLRFLSPLPFIFSSPAQIIFHGLDNALGFLLDEGTIDPNAEVPDMPPGVAISLLFVAATRSSHDLGCLRLLLSRPNINVNAADRIDIDYQCNIVHTCAVCSGVSTDALRAVLNHPDIDVNARDTHGSTALHSAYKMSREEEKTRILLEAGADPSLANDSGITPIDLWRSHPRRQMRRLGRRYGQGGQ